ncbi:MAG: hypothetical protein WC868_02670 [Bacteroidales bacterium]
MRKITIILFLFGIIPFVQGQKFIKLKFNVTNWEGKAAFVTNIHIITDNVKENRKFGVTKFDYTINMDSLATIKIQTSKIQNRSVTLAVSSDDIKDNIYKQENLILTDGQAFNIKLNQNQNATCDTYIQGIFENKDSIKSSFLEDVFSHFFTVYWYPCFPEFYHDDFVEICFDIDKTNTINNVRFLKNLINSRTYFVFDYLKCVEKYIKKEKISDPVNNIIVRLNWKVK